MEDFGIIVPIRKRNGNGKVPLKEFPVADVVAAVADYCNRRKSDAEAIAELLKKNAGLLAMYDLVWQDYRVPSITMAPLIKSLAQKCAKDPAAWDLAIAAGLQVKNPRPEPQP